ncbi:hypothetical protein EDB89DRAFT_1170384 [Lactarius sanguifluus]|nr:hypothetical protein EDB89DRAFT_1170384 [Lactarius sanguifluus]
MFTLNLKSHRRATTIDALPENVLLEIFDICRKNHDYTLHSVWKWHIPTHVCRKWRQIVIASPRRLNLQILCTHRTPARKNLGIWPAFPIAIDYQYLWSGNTPNDEDNIIAALEHPDRVCYLGLDATGPQLGKIVTVMQEPFPVLTRLYIFSRDGYAPVLPAKFLGGSASRLKTIALSGIPFPELPVLLLSTSDLVTLKLRNIPPTGYISPEAMVVALAALPGLETFIIEFQSATPRPDRPCPHPVTRAVLPALNFFHFRGASEYLEDLVTRIDSPRLNWIHIYYLNQLVDFQVTQLSKFIDRSGGLKSTTSKHARVTFFRDRVTLTRIPDDPTSDWRPSTIGISCQGIDWQVSHIAQAQPEEDWQLEDADGVEWLHLLHQFSTVQTLEVSRNIAGHVALALEDIREEMVVAVLPSLDSIYLVGQPTSSIKKFTAFRRKYGHLVAFGDTSSEFPRCESCNLIFGRSQEFKRHFLQVHTPPRRCPLCPYKWTRPDKVKAHLMNVHRDEFPQEVLNEIHAKRGQHLVAYLDTELVKKAPLPLVSRRRTLGFPVPNTMWVPDQRAMMRGT